MSLRFHFRIFLIHSPLFLVLPSHRLQYLLLCLGADTITEILTAGVTS